MSIKDIELKNVTIELIKEYVGKFATDRRTDLADNIIKNVIKQSSQNNDLEKIWMKVCLINSLYSTNVRATFEMAEHILDQNVDESIENGDPTIVNKIAEGVRLRGDRKRRFYSFASKYCSWHNQADFPIYDSFVEKTLRAYQRKDKFYEPGFTSNDLMDYPKFKIVIEKFMSHYKLSDLDFKKVDKFLYIYGKELFS